MRTSPKSANLPAVFLNDNQEQTMKPSKKTLRLVAVLALVLGLAACSKVNRQNYDQLKLGMGYAEVVALLGEPAQCDALVGFKSCVWGKGDKTITIRLVSDKVILFESQGL